MDTWLDTASQWLTSLFATPTAPPATTNETIVHETTSNEPLFHLMPVARVSII